MEKILIALVLAMGTLGCGKEKLSPEKTKTVAKAVTGFNTVASSGTETPANVVLKTQLGQVRDRAHGLMWLARFQGEAQARSTLTCDGGTYKAKSEDGFVSCEYKGESDCKKLESKCSLKGERTVTCKDGENFIFKDGEMEMKFDLSSLSNENSTTLSGTMKFMLKIVTTVSGTNLEPKKLKVKIDFELDFSKLAKELEEAQKAGSTPKSPIYNKDNISVTYDGAELDPDTIEEAFSSANSCKGNSLVNT